MTGPRILSVSGTPQQVNPTLTNMREEVFRNANKFHEEDKFNKVFIKRCLNREDEELLKEKKLEEAEARYAERFEEDDQFFATR